MNPEAELSTQTKGPEDADTGIILVAETGQELNT
jgi:hypothetical protein